MYEKQEQSATTLGQELGAEVGGALFAGNDRRVEILMEKRQRRLNICREKWNEAVAVAFNHGFTKGLFQVAHGHAAQSGISVEDAEKVITDWVSSLKAKTETLHAPDEE